MVDACWIEQTIQGLTTGSRYQCIYIGITDSSVSYLDIAMGSMDILT